MRCDRRGRAGSDSGSDERAGPGERDSHARAGRWDGGLSFGRHVSVHFANYAQIGSLHPGRNTLSLRLRQFFGAPVRTATLQAGMSIAATEIAPAKLALAAAVDRGMVHVGGVIHIHYTASSLGLPAREVGVLVSPGSSSLLPLQPPTMFWRWLTAKQGTVPFLATAPGTYQVTVFVSATTGIGGAVGVMSRTVSVHVLPAANHGRRELGALTVGQEPRDWIGEHVPQSLKGV